MFHLNLRTHPDKFYFTPTLLNRYIKAKVTIFKIGLLILANSRNQHTHHFVAN